jgi:hypothetical protein
MAQFTSTTAPLKHNHGMDKSDVEQGFERLDSAADANTFARSCRSPERQGWRNSVPQIQGFGDDPTDYTD